MIYAAQQNAELRPTSFELLFSQGSALHKAAKGGNIKIMKGLLKDTQCQNTTPHFNPESIASFGMTPLFWAVYGGQEPAVRYLLSLRANPNHVDTFGRSPIFYVFQAGHKAAARKIIQILAISGANLEAMGEHTIGPLICAAVESTGDTDLLLEFAYRGAKPLDEETRTIFQVASFRGKSISKCKELLPTFRRETYIAAQLRIQCIDTLLQGHYIPQDLRKLIWKMELPWSPHVLSTSQTPPSY